MQFRNENKQQIEDFVKQINSMSVFQNDENCEKIPNDIIRKMMIDLAYVAGYGILKSCNTITFDSIYNIANLCLSHISERADLWHSLYLIIQANSENYETDENYKNNHFELYYFLRGASRDFQKLKCILSSVVITIKQQFVISKNKISDLELTHEQKKQIKHFIQKINLLKIPSDNDGGHEISDDIIKKMMIDLTYVIVYGIFEEYTEISFHNIYEVASLFIPCIIQRADLWHCTYLILAENSKVDKLYNKNHFKLYNLLSANDRDLLKIEYILRAVAMIAENER